MILPILIPENVKQKITVEMKNILQQDL